MSREQIDAALALATQIRDNRAVLRARVRPLENTDGRYELAAILDEGHHQTLAKVPVVGFLKWAKRMVAPSIRLHLAAADCSEFRLIGELSERQRKLLLEALRLDVPSLSSRVREMQEDVEIQRWAANRAQRKEAA